MHRQAILTCDFGFGDSGKGSIVDFLCRTQDVDLVIRYCGGSQAGHNVETSDGFRHTFSQFGAGTLVNVRTYLGPQVIISPGALMNEAQHLMEIGVKDPFSLLAIHPQCLVATPYHRALNRVKEICRLNQLHGSCGMGIGETRSYWLRYGFDALTVFDLGSVSTTAEKLELLRQRLLLDLPENLDLRLIHQNQTLREELKILEERSPKFVASLLCHDAKPYTLEDYPYHKTDECVVFEGAQGVLLDEWYGFPPYTTWSTVTYKHAVELLDDSFDESDILKIGIIRAYMTRHGRCPFPTYDPVLVAHIQDIGNPFNPWQGYLRAGWLDMPLLRYAKAVLVGNEQIGSPHILAVNCVDHLEGIEPHICERYFMQPDLEPSPYNQKLMNHNTTILRNARPEYRQISLEGILEALREIAPVGIVGRGPTWRDKEWIDQDLIQD